MAFNSSIWGNVLELDGGHKRHRMSKVPHCECVVAINGRKYKEVVFSFYKDSEKKVFGNLKRGMFGINEDSTRIYFKGATNGSNSISIYSKDGGCCKKLKLRFTKPETAEYMKKFVGSYNFEFDNEAGFYYININHKLL